MEAVGEKAAAIARAHAALRDDLGTLEASLTPGSGAGFTARLRQLATTRVHFEQEERAGSMDEVREHDLRLEHPIERLRQEHHELGEALDTLLEEAEAAGRFDAQLSAKIRRWIERVRRYQQREIDLVQEAFERDLGAGD